MAASTARLAAAAWRRKCSNAPSNPCAPASAETFDLLLDHDFGWDDGLICGGKVLGLILPDAIAAGHDFWAELARRRDTVTWGVKKDFSIAPAAGPATDWLYRETITPPCNLWIAGAGHIAQAVAPLAAQLDFKVTVFDDRPALANHHYFPRAISLETGAVGKTGRAAAAGDAVLRADRHARPPPRRARAQGLDPQAVSVPRHDRQLAQGADDLRAFPRGKNRDAGATHARRLSRWASKSNRRACEEIAVSIMAQFIEKRAELVHEQAGSAAAKSELVG